MLTISMTKNQIKNKVYDCITFYQANMLFQLRFEILKDVDGAFRCRTAFNCTSACPRGIQVTKAIEDVKRETLTIN